MQLLPFRRSPRKTPGELERALINAKIYIQTFIFIQVIKTESSISLET